MGVVGRLNQQIVEVISNYLSINLSSWLNRLLTWSEANYLTFLGFYHTSIPTNEADNCIRGKQLAIPETENFFPLNLEKKKKNEFLLRTMTLLQEFDWIWGHNMSPGLIEILEAADHKQTSSCTWWIYASGNSKVLLQNTKSFPRVRGAQEEWLIPLLNLEVDSQRTSHFRFTITYKSPL